MFNRYLYSFLFILALGLITWKAYDRLVPSNHLELIQAHQAHGQNLTGKGVAVAVIDEGFDFTHPALQKNMSFYRYNTDVGQRDISETMVFQNGRFEFDHHGTHVSGLIAGNQKNIGVAPQAEIIPIKMGLWGGDQAFVKALDLARTSPASIVNISMKLSHSGREISPNVQEALFRLGQSGKIVVVAAGNDGIPMHHSAYTQSLMQIASSPSMNGHMLVVGAMTYKEGHEELAPFSNYPGRYSANKDYFITAPGVEITSSFTGKQFGNLSGTSMASPIVAGVLALLKERFPDAPHNALVALLQESARKVSLKDNTTLPKAFFGQGVVNAAMALNLGPDSL